MIQPLVPRPIAPTIALLPKADLHLHQERAARLDRITARRQGLPPYDWRRWARRVLGEVPPGVGRLDAIYEPDAGLPFDRMPADPEGFRARVIDALEEGAAGGAVLLEVRFGNDEDFVGVFREAERRVQERYPRLRAEAISYVCLSRDPERLLRAESRLEASLRAAREGLAGIDFSTDPYGTEADPAIWSTLYRWAERAADAGLGITVHVGEFSTANLAAALRVPGLRRLGHAVYAAQDPVLLDQLASSGVTVELCLTSNVILGAVPSYEAHPIRRFVERGIPVTLNTDLPVHVCTTIEQEYAVAAALGFSSAELLRFTRSAVQASFTSDERRGALLDELDEWAATLAAP